MNSVDPTVWVVVVAAGSGSRFGAAKQFLELAGERMVDRSVRTAARHSNGVVVVLPNDRVEDFGAGGDSGGSGRVKAVAGGASRSESVRNGLAAVPQSATVVLVHDGARPLTADAVYERVIAAVAGGADAAVPGVDVVDSVRVRGAGALDRDTLVAVQTPQGFRASVLRQAHASSPDASDDATVVEAVGGKVVVVDGDPRNLKITNPLDFELARLILADGDIS